MTDKPMPDPAAVDWDAALLEAQQKAWERKLKATIGRLLFGEQKPEAT